MNSLFVWIGANTKGMVWSGSSYVQYGSGDVTVDNDYRSKDGSYWSCLESESKTDDDGFVKEGESRVFKYPHEKVNAEGTFDNGWSIQSGSCKQTTWDDPNCG